MTHLSKGMPHLSNGNLEQWQVRNVDPMHAMVQWPIWTKQLPIWSTMETWSNDKNVDLVWAMQVMVQWPIWAKQTWSNDKSRGMYTQCNDPFEQKNSPFDQQWKCGAMTREECRPSASNASNGAPFEQRNAPFEQWKLGAMTREECPIWAMEAGAMEEHWGLWSERGINV
jgi:hypothetical protein